MDESSRQKKRKYEGPGPKVCSVSENIILVGTRDTKLERIKQVTGVLERSLAFIV